MAATEQVWFAPATERDEFGESTPVAFDDLLVAPDAVCIPRRARESDSGGIIAISGFEIFVRPVPDWAATIDASTTVMVRGEEHEIDGTPAVYLEKALQVFTRRVGT